MKTIITTLSSSTLVSPHRHQHHQFTITIIIIIIIVVVLIIITLMYYHIIIIVIIFVYHTIYRCARWSQHSDGLTRQGKGEYSSQPFQCPRKRRRQDLIISFTCKSSKGLSIYSTSILRYVLFIKSPIIQKLNLFAK